MDANLLTPPPDRAAYGHLVPTADALGGLASWWLAEAAVGRLAEARPWCRHPPVLPTDLGCCWPVLCRRADWAMLRPAFPLPVRWERENGHDPRLPQGLSDEADRVLDALGVSGWRLTHAVADPPDLSGLALDPPSAWAPLAAGLQLAVDGIHPTRDVWATGMWQDGVGVVGVGHVADKLAAAAAFGATRVFVPAGNADDARRSGADVRMLRFFPIAARPADALREYLSELGAPPRLDVELSDESFAACRAYHERLPKNRATDYFLSDVLPRVARDRRAQVRADFPDWRPTHVVTVVSKSPELAVLGAAAVGAEHGLLLHTPDQAELAGRVVDRLRDLGVRTVTGPFTDDDGLMDAIGRHVAAFLAGVAPGKVAADITPGTKLMSRAVERAAPAGGWLVHFRHEFLNDGKAAAGSQRVVRLPAG